MTRIKWFAIVCALICASMVYGANDVTTGEITEGYQLHKPVAVALPENFDVEAATAAIREARQAGDQELVRELAAQLSAYWQNNVEHTYSPQEHGYNAEPPKWNTENKNNPQSGPPDWGDDVRIAPEDEVRDVRIASISNGDLYSIAIRVDASGYAVMMHRSTDDGQTWTVYWDNAFGAGYSISSVGIANDNDTLVTWYILTNSSNQCRTWVRVVLPGGIDNPIYYGSPTGGFNPVGYNNLHITTDAPVYGTGEYIYATWTEVYGTGPDSTRVMSAVSYENDVSTWELGPTRLRASSGANIYYTGTRTAYGSATDRMWIVAWLHPLGYPTTYDRQVRGWYSDNYGATWNTTPVDITSATNGIDEYECALAGSHSNTNWVVLATQDTVTTGVNHDVNCWYSTDDGANWTFLTWITNYDNYLSDVWVDENSTAFYAACRSNSAGAEHERYKEGSISDPASWTNSVIVNDNTTNLSDVYGPSVSYNMGTGDAILAWTDYASSIYSIWFDAEGWTAISERPGQEVSPLAIGLAPNPAKSIATLSYTTQTEGRITVSLYDAAGRLVENLVNETKAAGTYSTAIDSRNIAAGIYFVRVTTPDGIGTKTMTIVR
jgi:hypothetical protein